MFYKENTFFIFFSCQKRILQLHNSRAKGVMNHQKSSHSSRRSFIIQLIFQLTEKRHESIFLCNRLIH